MLHELKILPTYFASILDGTKRFEIRREDRAHPYSVGDRIRLREHCPEGYHDDQQEAHYTGRECFVRVIYRTDFMQHPGVVVLGISDPI